MGPLPASTILHVEVGSGAHGTGLPGHEDHDEMVVYVEPPEAVVGVTEYEKRSRMLRTQPDGVPSGPGDTDRIVYTLRRFLRLALGGNPSVLLALWAPILTPLAGGESLRFLAPAFIGRHLIAPHRGYMHAQRERLEGLRGGRHGQMRDDPAGYDTKYAMHAARLGFQGLELMRTGGLALPIDGEPGTWLRSVRRGEVGLPEVLDRISELDASLEALETDESIREGPDSARITAWSIRAHLTAWRGAVGP